MCSSLVALWPRFVAWLDKDWRLRVCTLLACLCPVLITILNLYLPSAVEPPICHKIEMFTGATDENCRLVADTCPEQPATLIKYAIAMAVITWLGSITTAYQTNRRHKLEGNKRDKHDLNFRKEAIAIAMEMVSIRDKITLAQNLQVTKFLQSLVDAQV